MSGDMVDDKTQAELALLRKMMTWPDKQHMLDTLKRRIFALEQGVEFTNPFDEVNEVLYRIGGRQ